MEKKNKCYAFRIKKIALHCNFSVKVMSGTRQRRDTLNAYETFTLKVQHVFVIKNNR